MTNEVQKKEPINPNRSISVRAARRLVKMVTRCLDRRTEETADFDDIKVVSDKTITKIYNEHGMLVEEHESTTSVRYYRIGYIITAVIGAIASAIYLVYI